MVQARCLPIAAPSFVIPASVAENARFLAHKVEEVGLCLFETKACQAYAETDIPQELRGLPLRWHVHLPLDLPWVKGGATAARAALSVVEKVRFLRPRVVVLHPPTFGTDAQQNTLLQDFFSTWHSQSNIPILLENIKNAPLYNLDPTLFSEAASCLQREKKSEKKSEKKGKKNTGKVPPSFGVCLDVAHMLTFNQQALMQRADLLAAVRLLHWSAPGPEIGRDQHRPLTELSVAQREVLACLMPLLPAQVTHMVEVFNFDGVQASVPILQQFLELKA